ncbi:MAG: hypothetical protein WEG36_07280 [Gemmatimonadota bacterium]
MDPQFRELFLDGGVRYLNAYPEEPKTARRLLPLPASLRLDRDEDGRAIDLCAEGADGGADSDGESSSGSRARRLDRLPDSMAYGFLEAEGFGIHAMGPGVETRFHHQRDRSVGKPIDGGIFTYQALSPGQTFVGHVLLDASEDVARALAGLMERCFSRDRFRMGRSRMTEYGGRVVANVTGPQDASKWSEQPIPSAEIDKGQRLTVTFVSEYAGPCDFGGAARAEVLRELADRGIRFVDDSVRWFGRQGVRGGFPSVWRMPLPESRVFEAGTLLSGRVAKRLEAGDLHAVEWAGLGGRRAEGYGRVVFNWHGQDLVWSHHHIAVAAAAADEESDSRAPLASGARTEEGRRVVAEMEARLIRAELNRRLGPAARKQVPDRVSVAGSVLARLRERVRTARSPHEIEAWLKDAEDKKAGRALKKLRLGEEGQRIPTFDFVRALLQEVRGRPAIWAVLGLESLAKSGPRVQKERNPASSMAEDPGAHFEYLRRFLDQVLTVAMDRSETER